MRALHLNKSGHGFTSMTACGRNILRTPLSADWAGFSKEPVAGRCEKCEASKQAEVNRKMDAKNEAADAANWIAEDDAVWMAADDKLIAAHRARQVA